MFFFRVDYLIIKHFMGFVKKNTNLLIFGLGISLFLLCFLKEKMQTNSFLSWGSVLPVFLLPGGLICHNYF